jgi:serine protease Do
MHPIIRRTFAFGLAAALLACSRDGHAATTEKEQQARPSGESLFREAAQGQTPAAAPTPTPEAQLGLPSLAPLIDRLKSTVVNISTTTVTKHPRSQGPRGGPRGQQDFEDFFERYFGRPMPEPPQEFRGQSLGSGSS